MAKTNVVDTGESIWSRAETFLVQCPKCKACATINQLDPDEQNIFAPRRLVCKQCGLTKDWTGRSLVGGSNYGPPKDPAFQLPLWLQSPCCGRTLWAYNPNHLSFLKEYVSAELRQRRLDPKFGWFNRSMASRLPAWLISSKNREHVLKAIGKLEKTIG